ncbi:MAG: c-type cytochrome [Planctomycetota bacterium]
MPFLSTTSPLVPLADGAWDWFRPASSTNAEAVDSLFAFITWINIIFFVPIVALMVLFVFWYRKRPGHEAQHSPHHSNTLEITWSVIPLILVVIIFSLGFKGFLDMRVPPDDAYEIAVQAKKWGWSFTYPNGLVTDDLHVPVDRPVKLVLSSVDVIHSLYIPAFRVKMDCVPGRYNTMWFEATEPSKPIDADGDGEFDTGEGGYDLFCTEYCGTGHSAMMRKVHVYASDLEFVNKLDELSDVRKLGPPEEVGEQLYVARGCKQCHTIDGTDRPGNGGPSFKGHYGKENAFTDGSSVKMDENYIRESILYPQKLIRSGYKPIMPTYQGQFSDDELFAIIAYIKKLNGADVPDWLPQEGDAGDSAADPAGDGQPDASDDEAAAETPAMEQTTT